MLCISAFSARSPRVLRGVDVHGAVLDVREIVLELMVHALCDGVRVAQRQRTVDRDLGIDIRPAAEQPRLEIVHAHDTGILSPVKRDFPIISPLFISLLSIPARFIAHLFPVPILSFFSP